MHCALAQPWPTCMMFPCLHFTMDARAKIVLRWGDACRRDKRLGMRHALLMNEARRPSLDGSLASGRHHHRQQAF